MTKTNQISINSWNPSSTSLTRTAVSVDCVIFGYDQDGLKVLVLDCNMHPYQGKKSLVGELIQENESIEEAAKRILKMWTGVEDIYMEQVQAFGCPDRHPQGRVISIAYYSLVQIEKLKIKSNQALVSWEPLSNLSDMAFDHNEIMTSCFNTLKIKIREKPLGFSLLPKKFSLNQLQNLYESILEIEMDKRNFRRKLNSLDLLIDLGETESNVHHRPAKLFSFDYEKYYNREKKGKMSFEL